METTTLNIFEGARRITKLTAALITILLLSSCNDSSERECYEATKAVAETTEKSELTKNNPSNPFWIQAMYKAVIWRSKACKVSS